MHQNLRRWPEVVWAEGPTRRAFLTRLLAPPLLVFAALILIPSVVRILEHPEPTGSPGQSFVEETTPSLDTQREVLRVDSLRAEAAFLRARLALARTESLAISIDLSDSVLAIEYGGIVLRACPIAERHVSREAAAMLASWPSEIHTLVRSIATIPHAPIRTIAAPRDTAEANARPPDVIPVGEASAFAVLTFEGGLRLFLRPASAPFGSRLSGILLLTREHLFHEFGVWRAVVGADRVPREFRLDLVMTAEDVRAVYRALAPGARMAIRG